MENRINFNFTQGNKVICTVNKTRQHVNPLADTTFMNTGNYF